MSAKLQHKASPLAEAFKSLLNNASDGVIVLDESGRIVAANSKCTEICGYTQNELSGQRVNLLMPRPYQNQNGRAGSYLQSDDTRLIGIGRKVVGQRKSGVTFPMQIGVTEEQVDGQRYFIGTFRDLSQQNEIEGKLQFFSSFMRLASDGVIFAQSEGNSSPRIVFANDAFCRLFGYSEAELMGESPSMLYREDSYAHGLDRLYTAIQKGTGTTLELPLYRKDRREIWVELAAHPIEEEALRHWQFIYRDITARRELEQSLRHAADETKRQNQTLQRTLDKEVLLREINELVRTELDIARVADAIARAIANALKADSCFIRDFREEGEEIHAALLGRHGLAESALQPAFEENSGLWRILAKEDRVMMVDDVEKNDILARCADGVSDVYPGAMLLAGTFFDGRMNGVITVKCRTKRHWQAHESALLEGAAKQLALAIERDKIHRKLIAARQEFETRAHKLAELLETERKLTALQGDFVAMASHEFRTPLAIIDSSIQLLERKFNAEGETKDEYALRHFSKIRRAVGRMVGLAESTLNLSRLETGKVVYTPAPFNLKEFLEEIGVRYSGLKRGGPVVFSAGAGTYGYYGDRKLLDQVFTNLLTNAQKFSAESGSIELSLYKTEESYVVQVQDHGLGIPMADIPHLFERFFRARNAVGVPGTGVGLYVSRLLVDMHRGRIEVESIEGQGSLFTVYLPHNA